MVYQHYRLLYHHILQGFTFEFLVYSLHLFELLLLPQEHQLLLKLRLKWHFYVQLEYSNWHSFLKEFLLTHSRTFPFVLCHLQPRLIVRSRLFFFLLEVSSILLKMQVHFWVYSTLLQTPYSRFQWIYITMTTNFKLTLVSL